MPRHKRPKPGPQHNIKPCSIGQNNKIDGRMTMLVACLGCDLKDVCITFRHLKNDIQSSGTAKEKAMLIKRDS